MDESILRDCFVDICNGFTSVKWGKSIIYIKHITHYDQTYIERERLAGYEAAIKRKIPNNEDKLKWLEKTKIWTKKDEQALIQAKSYADNLKKTKDRLVVGAQIKAIEKQYNDALLIHNSLFNKKDSLVGLTAEKYAESKMQNAYLLYCFYKDEDLKTKLFSNKEFKNIDDEELGDLIGLYMSYMDKINDKSIRLISVSDFFINYFYLSESFSDFFGIPITKFSSNQVSLCHYAKRYREIFKNYDIPSEISKNPEEIDNYVLRAQGKKNMNLPKDGRVGIIGATKEADGQFFGEEEDTITRLAKMGGVSDIFDAHVKTNKLNKS